MRRTPSTLALFTLLLALVALPHVALAGGRGARAAARPGIIFTVPSRSNARAIHGMARAARGAPMIARVNLHKVNAVQLRKMLPAIREIADKHGAKLMLDLPGGMARTGPAALGGSVSLAKGERFQLVSGGRARRTTARRAWVGHKLLTKDVAVGDTIVVEGGAKLKVTSIVANKVNTRVLEPGSVGSRSVLAIAGKDWTFSPMVRRDRRALKKSLELARAAGFKNSEIVIANSMASSPHTVAALDRALARHGAGDVKRFVKVENNRAVKNVGALARVADTLIVARNDLGIAVGKNNLVATQARIAKTTHAQPGTGLVIGGAFLKSMLAQRTPSSTDKRDLGVAAKLAPSWVLITPTATAKDPAAIVAAAREQLDR